MVMGLSVFNISNGLNLAGVTLPVFGAVKTVSATPTPAIYDPNVTLENGVQVVRMAQNYNGYSPRAFTIQKGVPVKWVITSTNSNSCAASIFSAQLGIRQYLKLGENIIEFTPTDTGSIKFSCSMGMYVGSFNVVDASVAGSKNR